MSNHQTEPRSNLGRFVVTGTVLELPSLRPAWASVPATDDFGVHVGPSTCVDSAQLDVHTAWSAAEGSRLWMDTLIYDGRDLTPSEARRIAVGLLQAADLVEGSS